MTAGSARSELASPAARTGRELNRRVLVAGVGNIFLGDDGFGVEVVRQLAARPLPAWVEVADIGIRSVHLAYELLDRCELLVLVDAAPRGEPPGTVSLLEVDLQEGADGTPDGPVLDPHSLAPDQVLSLLRRLGSPPVRTLVVACEPADLTAGIELSAPVRDAVPRAVQVVEEVLAGVTGDPSADAPPVVPTGPATAA
jgi:hydrogenase maturation protease